MKIIWYSRSTPFGDFGSRQNTDSIVLFFKLVLTNSGALGAKITQSQMHAKTEFWQNSRASEVKKVMLLEKGPNPCSVLAAIVTTTGSYAVRPLPMQVKKSTKSEIDLNYLLL